MGIPLWGLPCANCAVEICCADFAITARILLRAFAERILLGGLR